MTNTAVIMARGLGTRMRRADSAATLSAEQSALADAGVKGMISVGRPFLDYLLSALADAEIHEVVIVIGPEHGAIRDYFVRVSPPQRVRVRFAEQHAPVGTAHAVAVAAEVVGDEGFLVLNADNYYPVQAYRQLAALPGAGVVAFDRDALVSLGNIDVNRVRSFATLELAPNGTLCRIVEKPGESFDVTSATARWVGMNCWRVSPQLVDACRRVPLSSRGEYELPEAVALALSEGVIVDVVQMSAGVLDLSQRSDIASVAAHLARVEARP